MLQEGVEALLAANQNLAGIIGTPATRPDGSNGIFPVQMPQNAPLPCVVYAVVAGEEQDSMDGRGELRVSRMQFSLFGETYAAVATAREAAKDALVGFRGELEDGTEIDAVFLRLEDDKFEATPKIYHGMFDVVIWHRSAS